jgi:hypothetical protein
MPAHEVSANNNAHLGATSGRDSDNTHLSTDTPRHFDMLEKDFSRQDGMDKIIYHISQN